MTLNIKSVALNVLSSISDSNNRTIDTRKTCFLVKPQEKAPPLPQFLCHSTRFLLFRNISRYLWSGTTGPFLLATPLNFVKLCIVSRGDCDVDGRSDLFWLLILETWQNNRRCCWILGSMTAVTNDNLSFSKSFCYNQWKLYNDKIVIIEYFSWFSRKSLGKVLKVSLSAKTTDKIQNLLPLSQ